MSNITLKRFIQYVGIHTTWTPLPSGSVQYQDYSGRIPSNVILRGYHSEKAFVQRCLSMAPIIICHELRAVVIPFKTVKKVNETCGQLSSEDGMGRQNVNHNKRKLETPSEDDEHVSTKKQKANQTKGQLPSEDGMECPNVNHIKRKVETSSEDAHSPTKKQNQKTTVILTSVDTKQSSSTNRDAKKPPPKNFDDLDMILCCKRKRTVSSMKALTKIKKAREDPSDPWRVVDKTSFSVKKLILTTGNKKMKLTTGEEEQLCNKYQRVAREYYGHNDMDNNRYQALDEAGKTWVKHDMTREERKQKKREKLEKLLEPEDVDLAKVAEQPDDNVETIQVEIRKEEEIAEESNEEEDEYDEEKQEDDNLVKLLKKKLKIEMKHREPNEGQKYICTKVFPMESRGPIEGQEVISTKVLPRDQLPVSEPKHDLLLPKPQREKRGSTKADKAVEKALKGKVVYLPM